jgi:hypothetical protein
MSKPIALVAGTLVSGISNSATRVQKHFPVAVRWKVADLVAGTSCDWLIFTVPTEGICYRSRLAPAAECERTGGLISSF